MRTGLYKGLSNEELVKLYKAGDAEAFDELMKKTEGLRITLSWRREEQRQERRNALSVLNRSRTSYQRSIRIMVLAQMERSL